MNRSSRIAVAAAAVVGIATVAALGYGFRDHLQDFPLVGRLVAKRGEAPGAPGMGDAPRPSAQDPAADPRAPVRLDQRRQQLVGVRTAAVERAPTTQTVRAVGTVRVDETRVADVNVKIEGWIRDLYVDYTGTLVSRGDPLFTLYSPDLLATQQEYLLALRTRDQLRTSQIADARERAERLVEAARARIELWDVPADQLRALEADRHAQTVVTFRSPVAGYVIEKQAVQGMHVAPGQTLYKVADLSRVWVEADVYEQDIPLVRAGQSATVSLDAYPNERFAGRAIYIYPFVEENTRTVRVRFAFANGRGRLKPGMYANVALEVPLGMGTTVPSNAVLDSGTRQVVFVAEGDGYFQPREVKVGRRLGDRMVILEGLRPGEQVATGATFFLDSESQLRASLQSYQPPPAPAAEGAAATELAIAFRPQPDPPRTGDNRFEVSVQDASGQPVSGATVSVTLFMPAMPTMNMPAMQSDAKLAHEGGGVYRGMGQILMAGRWDVTVNVDRGGRRVGSRGFSVVAK